MPLVPPAFYKQATLALAAAGISALTLPAAAQTKPSPPPLQPPSFQPAPIWKPVAHDGRDYVTARDIAAFYRFDRFYQEGCFVWFRSPTLFMRLEIETATLIINDAKYFMSHACVQRAGEILVSRSDLVKLIDPVLRPAYIKNGRPFDTVVVDPGHGGIDNGTRGLFGDEKAYTLDLGQKLKTELENRGLKVVMTRDADALPSKLERADLATATPEAVLVSLHFNQNRSGTVQGLETYAMTPQGEKSSNDASAGEDSKYAYSGNFHDSASLALATAVHAEVLRQCHPEDRGVRRARWAVLKEAERPGILVECGYISHPYEAMRIHKPEYRAKLAIAIADGVLNYKRAVSAPKHESRAF
ncbi:MAG: N-acetylmuramoyl-L-alanine amidase family protein [Verrucomicrobiales bacterium]